MHSWRGGRVATARIGSASRFHRFLSHVARARQRISVDARDRSWISIQYPEWASAARVPYVEAWPGVEGSVGDAPRCFARLGVFDKANSPVKCSRLPLEMPRLSFYSFRSNRDLISPCPQLPLSQMPYRAMCDASSDPSHFSFETFSRRNNDKIQCPLNAPHARFLRPTTSQSESRRADASGSRAENHHFGGRIQESLERNAVVDHDQCQSRTMSAASGIVSILCFDEAFEFRVKYGEALARYGDGLRCESA